MVKCIDICYNISCQIARYISENAISVVKIEKRIALLVKIVKIILTIDLTERLI